MPHRLRSKGSHGAPAGGVKVKVAGSHMAKGSHGYWSLKKGAVGEELPGSNWAKSRRAED